MPHKSRWCPIKRTIQNSIKYICNEEKTDNGILIHSENCTPQTASIEFEFLLRQARSGGSVIGRHLIQSFAPNEVTPKQAHEIGIKLADKILKGEYAYVMTTHINTDSIHNHFVWCAVNTKTHKRYRSNKKSYHEIQKASDELCEEYDLSVIDKKSGVSGRTYFENQQHSERKSYKTNLKESIDECIEQANSYAHFVKLMRESYDMKNGKYISFRAKGGTQERFTRAKTIGANYTEEKIKERIAVNLEVRADIRQGKLEELEVSELVATHQKQEFSMGTLKALQGNLANEKNRYNEKNIRKLHDLNSEKMQGSVALTRWAKTQNLKISAKSISAMNERGIGSMEELENEIEKVNQTIHRINNDIASLETYLEEVQSMRQYINDYVATKPLTPKSTGQRSCFA